MTLLIIILLATVSLSFLCSVMEATMLSTSTSYAETLAAKSSGGRLLKNLKQHTEKATTSILIFNTVANMICLSLNFIFIMSISDSVPPPEHRSCRNGVHAADKRKWPCKVPPY